MRSGAGPAIGDDIHSCGLYGWMALRGVWPDEKAPCELTDKADTGVFRLLELCWPWKPPSEAVRSGFNPARSRAVVSRDELIMVGKWLSEFGSA